MGRALKRIIGILATLALFSCSEQPNNLEQGKQKTLSETENVDSPSLTSVGEIDVEVKQPDAQDSGANETQAQKTNNPENQVVKLNFPDFAFKTLDWTDLLPKEDYEALSNPPSYLEEIEDGTEEDQISGQLKGEIGDAEDHPYYRALVSETVVAEMDDQPVRIPGFIVPLEFDDDQTITEFFLVPFFGACIHYPPPPPNQMVYVKAPEGFRLEVLYQPFWISGLLKTSLVVNDIASAAYSMQMQSMEPYEEP